MLLQRVGVGLARRTCLGRSLLGGVVPGYVERDSQPADPIAPTCPGHGPLADVSPMRWLRPCSSGVHVSLDAEQP